MKRKTNFEVWIPYYGMVRECLLFTCSMHSSQSTARLNRNCLKFYQTKNAEEGEKNATEKKFELKRMDDEFNIVHQIKCY